MTDNEMEQKCVELLDGLIEKFERISSDLEDLKAAFVKKAAERKPAEG